MAGETFSFLVDHEWKLFHLPIFFSFLNMEFERNASVAENKLNHLFISAISQCYIDILNSNEFDILMFIKKKL